MLEVAWFYMRIYVYTYVWHIWTRIQVYVYVHVVRIQIQHAPRSLHFPLHLHSRITPNLQAQPGTFPTRVPKTFCCQACPPVYARRQSKRDIRS